MYALENGKSHYVTRDRGMRLRSAVVKVSRYTVLPSYLQFIPSHVNLISGGFADVSQVGDHNDRSNYYTHSHTHVLYFQNHTIWF